MQINLTVLVCTSKNLRPLAVMHNNTLRASVCTLKEKEKSLRPTLIKIDAEFEAATYTMHTKFELN